jgi:hypothetical protein
VHFYCFLLRERDVSKGEESTGHRQERRIPSQASGPGSWQMRRVVKPAKSVFNLTFPNFRDARKIALSKRRILLDRSKNIKKIKLIDFFKNSSNIYVSWALIWHLCHFCSPWGSLFMAFQTPAMTLWTPCSIGINWQDSTRASQMKSKWWH